MTLDLETVYYPGQRREKYAVMIMLHSSWMTGLPEATEMIVMCRRASRGIDSTCIGGGIALCSIGTVIIGGYPVPLGL